MDKAQLVKAFTATVQASLHGLRSIEPILQREQTALTGKDPEVLEQLVQQKLALLKQVRHSVEARDRLQKTAGLPAGPEGGEKLVAALKQADLTRDWEVLTELARKVATLNDRNGQLAAQSQRATRAALGVLTGRPDEQDTYSTLGRGKRAGGGYSLGKV